MVLRWVYTLGLHWNSDLLLGKANVYKLKVKQGQGQRNKQQTYQINWKLHCFYVLFCWYSYWFLLDTNGQSQHHVNLSYIIDVNVVYNSLTKKDSFLSLPSHLSVSHLSVWTLFWNVWKLLYNTSVIWSHERFFEMFENSYITLVCWVNSS